MKADTNKPKGGVSHSFNTKLFSVGASGADQCCLYATCDYRGTVHSIVSINAVLDPRK